MSPEEIQQIYFLECEESLATAETGLAACRDGVQDPEAINSAFRGVHSIKGGAGAFGFAALQAYTHTFETLLSDVRDGSVPITPPLHSLLLRALDTLSDHVTAAREGGEPPADSQLIVELEAAQAANQQPSDAAPSGGPDNSDDADDFGIDFDDILADLAPAAGEAAEDRWTVRIRPLAGAMCNGSEPLLMLRELAALGGTCLRCETGRVPQIDDFKTDEAYLDWAFSFPGTVPEEAVHEVFEFVGSDIALAFGEAELPPVAEPAGTNPAAQPAGAAAATPSDAGDSGSPAAAPAAASGSAGAQSASGASVRIDLIKLDRLIDSVGELVIAQAMLAQQVSLLGHAASEGMALLESLTREIQESAMAIRAQPISSVFSRVPRILRDLAAVTNKHVQLEVAGETTELDKTVIERLSEPLTHLIRNAVDHGIEPADERIVKGKPPEGTIRLSAEQKSGRIVISVTDDGRGIDRDKVLAKAIEKGIVAADAQLSNEEIDNLIFAPGFSTAANVTSVSGRGVGMDVVRQNVKELGGRIVIDSTTGRGSTFTLTLPLTLAVSDGMIVDVGDQTVVLPLANVVESLRPGPGDVQRLGVDAAMLNVRGTFMPIIPVSQAIGSASDAAVGEGVLIVVDSEGAGRAALQVDAINDQRQFVIKSLDAHYRAVPGVAGATILGDGRVALILDVDSLVAGALGLAGRLAA